MPLDSRRKNNLGGLWGKWRGGDDRVDDGSGSLVLSRLTFEGQRLLPSWFYFDEAVLRSRLVAF